MRDHFSYLTDEPSNVFFQKLANAESGAKPRAVAPMAKTAAAMTPFEKVARRLDRDLEILRSVGSRGLNAGMQKRADVYIDQILNQANLSAEEFGEVFDKVAAAAIQGDLEAAYEQLTEDVPEEHHYVVEATLAKIGHDITSLALLEKEAFLGLLGAGARIAGRAFTRVGSRAAVTRGGSLAAKARMGRQAAMSTAPKALKAGRVEAKAVKALGPGPTVKALGPGPAVKALGAGTAEAKAVKAMGPGHAEAKAVNGMLPPKSAPGSAPPNGAPAPKTGPGHAEAKAVKTEGERAKATGVGRPANAASSATPAPAEAGQAKVVKAEGERAKATAAAADATKPAAAQAKGGGKQERPSAHLDLNEGETASSLKQQPGESRGDFSARSKRVRDHVDAGRLKDDTEGGLGAALDRGGGAGGAGGSSSGASGGSGGGGAGGGGGGANPKPPANPSGEVKAMDSFKKWTNEGWGALSGAEKGALIRAGAMGAAGYRMVTGKGAVTGGEGLI